MFTSSESIGLPGDRIMKSNIMKVFFFVKYNIELLPVWARILAVTFLAFVCYTTTVFVVNFLDDVLADHRISLFIVTALAVNLAVSPLVQGIARNLSALGRQIISEGDEPSTAMNRRAAAVAVETTPRGRWTKSVKLSVMIFPIVPEDVFLD